MAGHPVEQFPDQMANHRHVFADQVLDVARGGRVVDDADGGGELGRGGHVVLLARTNRLMKPADEKNSGRRWVQRGPKSVAFVEFFHEKPQAARAYSRPEGERRRSARPAAVDGRWPRGSSFG